MMKIQFVPLQIKKVFSFLGIKFRIGIIPNPSPYAGMFIATQDDVQFLSSDGVDWKKEKPELDVKPFASCE